MSLKNRIAALEDQIGMNDDTAVPIVLFNGGSDQARKQAEEAHARGWPVRPIVFSVQHVADTLEEAQEIVREFRQKSETDGIVVYKRGDRETELLREEAVIPDWVHG